MSSPLARLTRTAQKTAATIAAVVPDARKSVTLKAREAAAAVAGAMPQGGCRALAEPPAGSGLKPVMGEAGPPIVGQTLDLATHPLDHARRSYERFGEVFWTNLLTRDTVIVLGPSAIGTVLANRDRAFSNERAWKSAIGPFFERGLMLMDFEEHRLHRSIMQHAFKRDRLVSYLGNMNQAIDEGIAKWPRHGSFRLYPATKQLTLDIATKVFMGDELGPEADELNQAFIATVRGGAAVIRQDVPGGLWHRGLVGRQRLERYFREKLPAKRAEDSEDIFSVLCRSAGDDGERLTDDDVVSHMIFLMMAAHDTSTISLSMMAYYLAKHPEWQEQLREESLALGKDAIGYDDLEALPQMDLVFKETLRINAPVLMIARESIKDTEIEGHYVPNGTVVALGIYQTMRMEPWWKDPDTFDPERFAEHRREDKSHQYAWMPFGGNVHKCIGMHFGGMEVKAILHKLLQRNRWGVATGYEPPIEMGTGPLPADGLPIDFEPLER